MSVRIKQSYLPLSPHVVKNKLLVPITDRTNEQMIQICLINLYISWFLYVLELSNLDNKNIRNLGINQGKLNAIPVISRKSFKKNMGSQGGYCSSRIWLMLPNITTIKYMISDVLDGKCSRKNVLDSSLSLCWKGHSPLNMARLFYSCIKHYIE